MPYRLLLGCWICIVVAVTTYPWARFVPSIQWHRINWVPFYGVPILPGDIVANILLFFPFGFLWVVAYRYIEAIKSIGFVILLSFGLSMSVEIIQGFSLARFPSVTDVIFNVVGGGFGGLLGMWWLKAPPHSWPHTLLFPNVPSRQPSKPTKS